MSKIKKKNADGGGIRLLKHWKKGLFSIIFSRLGIILILLFGPIFKVSIEPSFIITPS